MNKKAGTLNGRQLRDRRGEILFMDLRAWNSNVEEIVIDKGKKKKKVVLTDAQIAEVKRVYNAWQSADTSVYEDVPEYCKAVKVLRKDRRTPDEITIEDKDFSFTPSKYIEFIDHDLEIDFPTEMGRIQAEMREVLIAEKKSQKMLEEAFGGIGYGII